jgi:hypothetical protein
LHPSGSPLASTNPFYHITSGYRRSSSAQREIFDAAHGPPPRPPNLLITAIAVENRRHLDPADKLVLGEDLPRRQVQLHPLRLIVVGRSTVQERLGPRWKSLQAIGPSERETFRAMPGCAVTQPENIAVAAATRGQPIFLSRSVIELTSVIECPGGPANAEAAAAWSKQRR